MKIIIAGKNDIAVNVTSWLRTNFQEVEVLAVFNRSDDGKNTHQRSFKNYCHKNNIQEISLDIAYEIEDSIFLSLEFDRIVKPERFSHDRLFNIHFSKLPQYKGMYTSAWPILNNEKESGVTLHLIDAGIDTGAILDQLIFPIDEDETAKSLYLKYIANGTRLVLKNIPSIINNTFSVQEQKSDGSSYYSKDSINYKKITIDLNKTAFEVLSQINAFTFRDFQLPEVYGFSIFGGSILSSRSSGKPGQILQDSFDKIVLSTIDYDLELKKDNLQAIFDICEKGNFHDLIKIEATQKILVEKNDKGWSPVIVAAYHGNIEMVRWLVGNGADINDRNHNGTTVAMYLKNFIAESRRFELLDDLVDMGADLSLQDYSGLTVFDYVLNSQDEELINELKRLSK